MRSCTAIALACMRIFVQGQLHLTLELYVDKVRLHAVRLPVCVVPIISEKLNAVARLGAGHQQITPSTGADCLKSSF